MEEAEMSPELRISPIEIQVKEQSESMEESDYVPANIEGNTKYNFTRFSEENLIQKVKENPILWNRYHPNYKNRAQISSTWEMISNKFCGNLSGHYMRRKWQNIRDNYIRRKKNYLADPKNCKQYKYWNILQFLDESCLYENGTKNPRIKPDTECSDAETSMLKFHATSMTETDEKLSNSSHCSENSMDNTNEAEEKRQHLLAAIGQLHRPLDHFDGFGMVIAAGLRGLPTEEAQRKQVHLLQVLYSMEDKDD